MTVDWIEEIAEGGEVTFRIGRSVGGLIVAEWPNEAHLFQEGDTWRFQPEPHVTPARAAKLRCGPACAVQRYFAGKMSLHASAVAIGGRALVFLGPSGAGKSTVAARLCEGTASLLADDVLAVDWDVTSGLVALPTESAHWLRSTDAPKASTDAHRVATEGATAVSIVALDASESLQTTPRTALKGRAAMLTLSKALITLPIATREQRHREFEWLAKVCQRIPITRIARTCGGTVDDVVSSALELLKDAT